MNLTQKETAMPHRKHSTRPPRVVVIAVSAIAALVALAGLVQAVRQESWAPILSIGWLPAVLVASLWTPAASSKPCWPRLRKLTGR
jgi:hypothetical protein